MITFDHEFERIYLELNCLMLPPGLPFRVKQNKDIEAMSGARDKKGEKRNPG